MGALANLNENKQNLTTSEEKLIERKKMEKLLSLAVEQSTEGIAITDIEGNLLFVNKAFADMHGYNQVELIGKHLSIFHTQGQMPSVTAANQQLLEKGEFHGEIEHKHRNGTVFSTSMHNTLVRDENGNPIGLIGTLRDITERKRAEEKLNLFKNISDNANYGIGIIDLEGNLVYTNEYFATIHGYATA